MYAFFDIHSHIHDKAFAEDREAVIAEMKQKGFGTITVGTGVVESKQAVLLAEQHEHIFATVGLHPADNPLEEYGEQVFEELARHEKVVAIGECGLDYYYIENFFAKDKEKRGISWTADKEKARQKKIFEEQIALAVKLDKPLMLHGRPTKGSMDAYEDMLKVLSAAKNAYGEKLRGNAHFFAGNVEIAKRFFDIGFTISFSGVITFAKEYDDVVRFAPLSMILAETDSPYATPAPFRGQRNTPLMVQEVVARIAVLREEPMEEVRAQLLENSQRMFHVA